MSQAALLLSPTHHPQGRTAKARKVVETIAAPTFRRGNRQFFDLAAAFRAEPDNCADLSNAGQENGDFLVPGDDCQCGDVTGDGGCAVDDIFVLSRFVGGEAVMLDSTSPGGYSSPG